MEVLGLVSNAYHLGRWHYLLLVFICLVPYPCWMLNLVLNPCSSLSVIPTFFDWLMTLSTEAAWPKCRGTSMGYRPLYQLIWPTLITTKVECRPSRLLKTTQRLQMARTWFGGVCSCCCLPPLPQFTCSILATTCKPFAGAQYSMWVPGNFMCIIGKPNHGLGNSLNYLSTWQFDAINEIINWKWLTKGQPANHLNEQVIQINFGHE